MKNIVTLFEGFVRPVEHIPLNSILASIKDGSFEPQVAEVRALAQTENKEQANRLKKKLPGFTPSGQFNDGRKANLLVTYSGYIILDLDDLGQQLNAIFQKAIEDRFTLSCFTSPSGNGLKIIVKVDSSAEYHEEAFKMVCNYYEKLLQVTIDQSGSDVCRLCFVSHDANLFLNQSYEIFHFNKLAEVEGESNDELRNNHDELFQKCIELTNTKLVYIPGNRNNYIHLLACNTNRAGIPSEDAVIKMSETFDLSSEEIYSIVAGVYKRQLSEFGKLNWVEEKEKYNSPFIPEEIFDQLPDLLRRGTQMFSSYRERDVFLTGALTILSGVISNFEGVYDQHRVYPNLYSFVVAPAASGKGALSYAKQLALSYHRKLLQESRDARKIYEEKLQLHRMHLVKKKTNETIESEPEEPPFKILFIPGNSSSSAIIQHLNDGDGRGIFCETEADTLNNSLKQDWGNFSDLLRRVFHHESIDKSRKMNREYIHIEIPRLSVALSGTPIQVSSLIKSAENGLFSRFMYYTFNDNPQWKDVSPSQSGTNLTKYFEQLSQDILPLVDFYDRFPTTFDLTEEQWKFLNSYGDRWLRQIVLFTGREASSMVKRLGLILYRIAMTLTAIRKFENADTSPSTLCDNIDFTSALKLCEVYLEHGILIFKSLPKNEKVVDQFVKKLFDILPASFQRIEAIRLGFSIGIQERTADGYLKKMVKSGLLSKTSYGLYEKS